MESQIIAAEELAPDTGKPVSKLNLGRFGAGFIFFCIVFMMSGTIGSTVLLPARFNTLGIGQGETILGTMNSIGIIFALISNVIFGALSDASHSRFGKRTPWIIVGGPIAGLGFYLTSISPTLPTIVASWSLLQIGLNCMIAPCVAILSDRVPQKYRGSMSAFYGAGQIVGQSMGTIIGSAFIDAPKTGFMIGTICWCLCGIGTVLLLPRELSAATDTTEKFDIKQVAMQFRPPTKGARDFYLALIGRLMLIFGYNMIVGYQLYVCMKYIGQDAKAAAATVSTMAVITMIVSLVVSLVSGPISDRIGKRKLPVYYNQIRGQHGNRYADLTQDPAFAFGEGLGYTTFKYGEPAITNVPDSGAFTESDTVHAEITLTNTGERKGIEVVQAYIGDIVTSYSWTDRELKSFKRVELEPGESKTVAFDIPVADCTIVDPDANRIVEPGEFELLVGHSSRREDLKRTVFTVA